MLCSIIHLIVTCVIAQERLCSKRVIPRGDNKVSLTCAVIGAPCMTVGYRAQVKFFQLRIPFNKACTTLYIRDSVPIRYILYYIILYTFP